MNPSESAPDPLAEIRARLVQVTPGPWVFPKKMKWMRQIFRQVDVDKIVDPKSGCPDHALATVHLQYCKDHSYPWEANADLIAHAPTDLAYLLTRLDVAEQVVQTVEAAMTAGTRCHECGKLQEEAAVRHHPSCSIGDALAQWRAKSD